jgi:hypothetical protein
MSLISGQVVTDGIEARISEDGGVLLLLPYLGLDPSRNVNVFTKGDDVMVSQDGRLFAKAAFDDPSVAETLRRTRDVELAEIDEDGFRLHDQVSVDS